MPARSAKRAEGGEWVDSFARLPDEESSARFRLPFTGCTGSSDWGPSCAAGSCVVDGSGIGEAFEFKFIFAFL